MKKRSHFPFVYLVLFYAGGILFARFIDVALSIIGFGIPLIFCLIVFLRGKRAENILLLALFMLLGAFSYQTQNRTMQTPLDKIARYNYGKRIQVVGLVTTDVRTRFINHATKKSFHLKVLEVRDSYGYKRMDAAILVQLFREQDIKYGDTVLLEGRLHRPFQFDKDSNTSYRQYLYRRGIKWILSVKKTGQGRVLKREGGLFVKRKALILRARAERILHQYLSKNEAGIMQAILLGNRSGLSSHVRGLFVQTGTAHILAISGLHIGVIAGLLLIFIKMFPLHRKAQYIITILILIGYVFLTGARPSILRATIMTVIFLGTFLFERNQSGYNTLGFAAFCLLVYNPFYLFDVGFQLSFSCVFSIILVSRHIKIGLTRTYLRRIVESLCISLGIWLGIAGLVAYCFMIVTPITIVANIFIVPLLTLIVSLGFGLILLGNVWPFAGHCFGVCTQIILNGTVALISFFNEWPGAYFYLKSVKLWQIALYYALLAVALFIFFIIKRRKSTKNILPNGSIKR